MDQLSLVLAQAGPPTGLEKILATLISGLGLGAIYALLALGFVIIFKATQVVNFAHGALAALGAYLVVYFAVVLNFPGQYLTFLPIGVQWAASAILGIVAAAFVGLLLELVFIRPMIGQPLFSVAIITLGIDAILRTVTNDLIGTGIRPLKAPFGDDLVADVFRWGNVPIPHTQVATVLTAVLLLVGVALFFRSRTGIAMRATAFDQETAMAQGISVGKVFGIAWMIGAALAAVAGVFVSVPPRGSGATVATAFVALRAFPVIVIGGLDSIVGAVVAGFGVGTIEVFAAVYLLPFSDVLGVGFSTIVPYLLMLVVLFIRPYGIFGTEEIRRV
ncbi:MAG: branched-chain amino acid ABC transporter permease [Acidimicrobiia bacterium]